MRLNRFSMGNRAIFSGVFGHERFFGANRDCSLLLTLFTKRWTKILHINMLPLRWIASQLKSNDEKSIRITMLCVNIGLRGYYYRCLRLFVDQASVNVFFIFLL